MFGEIRYSKQIVECSFSMMSYIFHSRSDRMEIETHTAIMTTKYTLKSSKSVALKFNWKDMLRDPVDSILIIYAYIFYMHTSSSRYKNCLKTKRDKTLLEKKIYHWKKCFQKKQRREERKLYTNRLLFIYSWPYFRLKLKFIVLETVSVIFCIQKVISVSRLFPSNKNKLLLK